VRVVGQVAAAAAVVVVADIMGLVAMNKVFLRRNAADDLGER
jgi:hypothetical protein